MLETVKIYQCHLLLLREIQCALKLQCRMAASASGYPGPEPTPSEQHLSASLTNCGSQPGNNDMSTARAILICYAQSKTVNSTDILEKL